MFNISSKYLETGRSNSKERAPLADKFLLFSSSEILSQIICRRNCPQLPNIAANYVTTCKKHSQA